MIADVTVRRILALASDDPVARVVVHRREAEVASRATQDAVAAEFSTNIVSTRTTDRPVASFACEQDVSALLASDRVGTEPTFDQVRARSREHDVVPSPGLDLIRAAQATDHVWSGRSTKVVVPVRPGDRARGSAARRRFGRSSGSRDHHRREEHDRSDRQDAPGQVHRHTPCLAGPPKLYDGGAERETDIRSLYCRRRTLRSHIRLGRPIPRQEPRNGPAW